MLVFLQRCGLSGLQKPLLYLQSSWVRPRIVLCKTKEENQKKRRSFFCENKVQRKNRILKSGIQPVMESGIHRCGIRNPQAWNPESTAWNPEFKTLLDYLTWGEWVWVLETSNFIEISCWPCHAKVYLYWIIRKKNILSLLLKNERCLGMALSNW